ncbi:Exopolysaccharide synthesis, ExoD [Rosistilla carotiformis]|uniref:Exopolysaccharide synthesis, ExoD n=1 Tax=Rosistilla carotiformis TaxID=2528017 RepID=A0A518JPN9_9BACT|nr:exopolysaccharide biosynthesis protein [Rosistilla carotiformis]QDV67488.1 Exopolysaccharide synthesis, ExoD [Rosistilla carotiformis]
MSENLFRSATQQTQREAGESICEKPLSSLLKRLDTLSERQETVSFGNALDAVGKHSFAPILLLIGLIMLAPGPADIPGVPVVLGVLIILVAVQILFRRDHLWVPQWLENREIRSQRVHKMIDHLKPWAKRLDRLTKPRYSWLLRHVGVAMIAVACILIALTTPLLEFVPMSANVAGAAIATFSLAILSKDGLLAGLAMLFSIGFVGIVAWGLLH